MTARSGLLVAWFLVGCKTLPSGGVPEKSFQLQHARESMEAGELYRARKMTEKVLHEYPSDPEAQKLMADILDMEIARQKEVMDTKAPEEFSTDENQEQVRLWLVQSRSLLEAQEYEQAVVAAENVFLFDPSNQEASSLIDAIRAEALEKGGAEALIHKESIHTEVDARTGDYYADAAKAIEKGQWGQAQFLARKILILRPDDDKALALMERIRAGQRSQAVAEAAETLNSSPGGQGAGKQPGGA